MVSVKQDSFVGKREFFHAVKTVSYTHLTLPTKA